MYLHYYLHYLLLHLPPPQLLPAFTTPKHRMLQVYNQFPCSFQFTEKFLIALADHSQASSFGTFLCDGEREREVAGVRQQTVSLWSFINQIEILSHHLNCLYLPNKVSN